MKPWQRVPASLQMMAGAEPGEMVNGSAVLVADRARRDHSGGPWHLGDGPRGHSDHRKVAQPGHAPSVGSVPGDRRSDLPAMRRGLVTCLGGPYLSCLQLAGTSRRGSTIEQPGRGWPDAQTGPSLSSGRSPAGSRWRPP